MNELLQLKPWQLFAYLLIVPVFIPDNENGSFIFVFYALLFIVWLLKINEELYKRLPNGTSLNLTLLQVNLIVSFIYFSIINLFTNGYHISSDQDNYAIYGWKLWIYIPFTFYILFSFAYAIHFTAYSIHTIENQTSKKSDNYKIILLGLFFFPIGIWSIQPKINKILNEQIREEITGK